MFVRGKVCLVPCWLTKRPSRPSSRYTGCRRLSSTVSVQRCCSPSFDNANCVGVAPLFKEAILCRRLSTDMCLVKARASTVLYDHVAYNR